MGQALSHRSPQFYVITHTSSSAKDVELMLAYVGIGAMEVPFTCNI